MSVRSNAAADDPVTRWRRTRTTYRRDARCSCQAPDAAVCGCADGWSAAWRCPCHTVNGLRPAEQPQPAIPPGAAAETCPRGEPGALPQPGICQGHPTT